MKHILIVSINNSSWGTSVVAVFAKPLLLLGVLPAPAVDDVKRVGALTRHLGAAPRRLPVDAALVRGAHVPARPALAQATRGVRHADLAQPAHHIRGVLTRAASAAAAGLLRLTHPRDQAGRRGDRRQPRAQRAQVVQLLPYESTMSHSLNMR